MKASSQPMSNQFPHYSIPVNPLGIILNCVSDITYPITMMGLFNSFIKRIFSDLHQFQNLLTRITYCKSIGTITMKTVFENPKVDRYHISLFQNVSCRK